MKTLLSYNRYSSSWEHSSFRGANTSWMCAINATAAQLLAEAMRNVWGGGRGKLNLEWLAQILSWLPSLTYSTVEYDPDLALKVKTIKKIIDIILLFYYKLPKSVISRLFFNSQSSMFFEQRGGQFFKKALEKVKEGKQSEQKKNHPGNLAIGLI